MVVQVNTPTQLTDRQKELLEEFARIDGEKVENNPGSGLRRLLSRLAGGEERPESSTAFSAEPSALPLPGRSFSQEACWPPRTRSSLLKSEPWGDRLQVKN